MVQAFRQLLVGTAFVAYVAANPAIVEVGLDRNTRAVSDPASAPKEGIINYHFVVEVPDDMTTISPSALTDGGDWGWPIAVAAEAFDVLDEIKDLAYISVMGYFSKGKTLIAAMLYNAGQSNKFAKRFEEASGKGVTTKGYSGVLTGSQTGDIANSTTLVIDFPGRNAPARRKGTTSAEMNEGITSLRAKERMMDYIATRISDLIVYVLDEVLNEDQRALQNIIQAIFRGDSKSQLVVVHNMKRLDCREKVEIHSLAEEMIQNAFGAKPMATESGIAEDVAWYSRWVDDATGKVVTVHHFMVFNDDIAECKETNKNTIKFISDFKFRYVEARTVRDAPPLEYFRRHLEEVLPDYLLLSDETSAVGDPDYWNEANNRSTQYGRLIVNNGKAVRLRTWDNPDIPSISTRDYKPAYAMDQNPTHHFLRVEVPGIKRFVAKGEDAPIGESWIRFYKDTSNRHVQTYVAEGERFRQPGFFTDNSNYGKFRIEAEVDSFFNYAEVHFDDGCLDVTSSRREVEPLPIAMYIGSTVAIAVGGLIAYLLVPSRKVAVNVAATHAARGVDTDATSTSVESCEKVPLRDHTTTDEETALGDDDDGPSSVGDSATRTMDEVSSAPSESRDKVPIFERTTAADEEPPTGDDNDGVVISVGDAFGDELGPLLDLECSVRGEDTNLN